MASTYFTLPSFARAKKNKEDLEKTNPKQPVLKDEDEQFLEKITSQGESPPATKSVQPTQIDDAGEEKALDTKPTQADGSGDQVAVPETKPEEESAEDPPEAVPESEADVPSSTSPAKTKKTKKDKGIDLPSQEEAEAATKGFQAQAQAQDEQGQDKRTWASYIPSVGSKNKPKDTEEESKSDESLKNSQTWAQYASAYVPSSLPSIPSLPASWSRSKDAKVEPVYNEDGSVDEEATKEKQEKEISVLLDNLNLSSINNRVFSFSQESQKFYERFTLVLKDIMSGAPTAYDDMEKLMKDAGPTLEKQLASMPPFVQTLVKSLPAKLGTTLAPELLAAASEKPGNDGKARMAAEKQANAGGDPGISTGAEKDPSGKKKKRTVPGLKGLVKEQGMVATILRNIVTFLRTRFPFLMSTTNVVMSLAVFILMFVFYYCWKRGRETRLAKAAEAGQDGEKAEDGEDGGEMEIEVTDEDDSEENEDGADEANGDDDAPPADPAKVAVLEKSDAVDLGTKKGDAGAETEAK